MGGVSTFLLEKDNEIDQVIHRADKALYHAKEEGRNKITLSACSEAQLFTPVQTILEN